MHTSPEWYPLLTFHHSRGARSSPFPLPGPLCEIIHHLSRTNHQCPPLSLCSRGFLWRVGKCVHTCRCSRRTRIVPCRRTWRRSPPWPRWRVARHGHAEGIGGASLLARDRHACRRHAAGDAVATGGVGGAPPLYACEGARQPVNRRPIWVRARFSLYPSRWSGCSAPPGPRNPNRLEGEAG